MVYGHFEKVNSIDVFFAYPLGIVIALPVVAGNFLLLAVDLGEVIQRAEPAVKRGSTDRIG
jgi:uncharacterized integral membrane protein